MPASRLCVFCGSRMPDDAAYADLAAEMGKALAAADVGLVYGGGSVGLMGILADAVMAAGGEVVGVIPGGLFRAEVAHEGLTELVVVADMHERKRTMYSLASGFVAMPGGLGTLEELFEVATWNQLGLHDDTHRIALLDRLGFWRPVEDLLDRTVADGFVRPRWRDLIRRVDSADAALAWAARID